MLSAIGQRTPITATRGLELRSAGSWSEVWLVTLAGTHPDELELGVLDDDERRRLRRLADPLDASAFATVHVALRQLLAAHLRCEAQDVAFRRERCPLCGNPSGRPVLDVDSSPVHFSIARSHRLGAIGLSSEPIGVDVQLVPSEEVQLDVAALLHEGERAEIRSATPLRRGPVFARLWTRKEAYLKARGVGVAHGLDSEYVGSDRRHGTPPRGWALREVPVPAGYAAAVAVRC